MVAVPPVKVTVSPVANGARAKPKINFRTKSIPPHLPENLFSSFLNTSNVEFTTAVSCIISADYQDYFQYPNPTL